MEEEIKEILPYERLLKIARKMHLWIFLNSGDDQKVYEGLGLTQEENEILGSIYVESDDDNEYK